MPARWRPAAAAQASSATTSRLPSTPTIICSSCVTYLTTGLTDRNFPMWPTRPRRYWAWTSSMPSPTEVTSTAKRSGHARRLASGLRCHSCAIKPTSPTGKERRVSRWEHEHILEAVQRRLDEHPEKMRQRRETVEHPFGTIKARMGATHFLMKTLPRVASEMALHVLAYNLTRVMNLMGIQPLMAAMRA